MESVGRLTPGYEHSPFLWGEAGVDHDLFCFSCPKLLWKSYAKIPTIRPSGWECNITTNSSSGGTWDRTDT